MEQWVGGAYGGQLLGWGGMVVVGREVKKRMGGCGTEDVEE